MQISPGGGVCLELRGEIGVLSYLWVLAPAAQQGPCAWPGLLRVVTCQGLRLLAWHSSASPPSCLAAFKQPCFQTKGIKFHVIWKLKQVDFISV